MMLRRFSVALLLLLFAACVRPPVREEMTIDFADDLENVTVSAETVFDLDAKTPEARLRIENARAAALAGTDGWSARFARLNAETERVTFQRNHGELERVSRSIVIPADDLQLVFSDSSITVHYIPARSELVFYPGTSTRATREQKERFERTLETWSVVVAHYFEAVRHLYSYMNANPQRARYLFAALLNEKGPDGAEPVVLEDEQPLIDAVTDAMDELAERLDEQQGNGATFAEETDMIFNPFPARVTVRVPGEAISRRGFSEQLTIEPADPLTAVTRLEGRWISPDPMAAFLRDEQPTADELAALPRHAEPVSSPTEIADAVRAELTRPQVYSVHWRP